MNNTEFVKEMRILWQGLDAENRAVFNNLIWEYFDKGDRSHHLIEKMQEKIE